MVGLAIELTTNAHAIEEPTGKGMASDRKTIIRVTGEHAMSRVLITGANRGLGLEFAISSASELRRLANTSEDKPDDGTGCYRPGTHDPIALKQWFIRQEMANATEHGLLVLNCESGTSDRLYRRRDSTYRLLRLGRPYCASVAIRLLMERPSSTGCVHRAAETAPQTIHPSSRALLLAAFQA